MTWPFSDRLSTNPILSEASAVNPSSFADLLRRQAPELLPANLGGGAGGASPQLPHGTTIVALRYPGGVVIAGDRRSTQGDMIAGRDVKKVYITDDYTATRIAAPPRSRSSSPGCTRWSSSTTKSSKAWR